MKKGLKTVKAIGIKAGPDDGLPEGRVSALVAVYGNKDSDGDVVERSEFEGFVKQFKSGDLGPLPHVNHHDHANPHAYSGEVVDVDLDGEAVVAGKTVKGLAVEVQFELDQPDNPAAESYAKKNYENIKRGYQKEWSYAWRADDRVKMADGYHLKGVSLQEVASVLRGANSLTRTLAVKADGDPSIEDVWTQLGEILDDDTLQTLVDMSGEQFAAMVTMIGNFADRIESGSSYLGVYSEPDKPTAGKKEESTEKTDPNRAALLELAASAAA